MANRLSWSGTATDLDGFLRAVTGNLENAKGWPAEPRILAARLRDLAPSLMKVGITVTFDKVGHDRTRIITLASQGRPDPVPEGPPPTSSGDVSLDLEGGGLADAADDADGADRGDDEVNSRDGWRGPGTPD